MPATVLTLPGNVNAPALDILRLHSAYRDGRFFVWGEVGPRKSSPRHLPFCAKPVRIGRAISQVVDRRGASRRLHGLHNLASHDRGKTGWPLGAAVESASSGPQPLPNPTHGPSRPRFFPPKVLSTSWMRAIGIPCAEDRDTKLAPSTRFWGAALRFVAGLALRDRFLPSMTAEGESFHARWKPLIAAPDQDRLRHLARAMPPVARAITSADAQNASRRRSSRSALRFCRLADGRASAGSEQFGTAPDLAAFATSTSTTSTRRG